MIGTYDPGLNISPRDITDFQKLWVEILDPGHDVEVPRMSPMGPYSSDMDRHMGSKILDSLVTLVLRLKPMFISQETTNLRLSL